MRWRGCEKFAVVFACGHTSLVNSLVARFYSQRKVALVASLSQGEKLEAEEVVSSKSSGKPVAKSGKETVCPEASLVL